jgi:hypothetical protein
MTSARAAALAIGVIVTLCHPAGAQSVRDHTRLTPDRSTVVTESQANELRLTLVEVAVRPIQIWVRTAGAVDASRRVVSATLPAAEGALVRLGQRVRAFAPETRSSMYQARITGVAPKADGVFVTVTLASAGREDSTRYVLEVVTEAGEFLSVPNEAIIESEGRRIVYVQQQGRYVPRDIQTGIQGELYTQILDGLKGGDQIVTFGSFFIDADYKLKGS